MKQLDEISGKVSKMCVKKCVFVCYLA